MTQMLPSGGARKPLWTRYSKLRMRVRRTFTLRFLFNVISLSAIGLGVWMLRPPRHVYVDVSPGTVRILDNEIQMTSLREVLTREARYRRRWMHEPLLILRTETKTPYYQIERVFELCKEAGFQEVSFAVR